MGLTAIDQMQINLACYQFNKQSSQNHEPTPSYPQNCHTWSNPTPYDQIHSNQWPSIYQEENSMNQGLSMPNAFENSYQQGWNYPNFFENLPQSNMLNGPTPNLQNWEQNQFNFSCQAQYEEQAHFPQGPSIPYDSYLGGQPNSSWDSYQGQGQNPLDQSFQNWISYSNDSYDQVQYGGQPTFSSSPNYPTSSSLNHTSQQTCLSPPCPNLNQEERFNSSISQFDQIQQLIIAQSQANQVRIDRLSEIIKGLELDQSFSYSNDNSDYQLPQINNNERIFEQNLISHQYNTQIPLALEYVENLEDSYLEVEKGVSYCYDDDENDENDEFEKYELSVESFKEVDDLKLGGREEMEDIQGHDQNPLINFLEFDEILIEDGEEDGEKLKNELKIYLKNAIGINIDLNRKLDELNLLNDNFDVSKLKKKVELIPIFDHSDSSDFIPPPWSDFALHLAKLAEPIEPQNFCVEKHLLLTIDPILLNQNHFLETPHSPIPENLEIEEVDILLNKDKVQIDIFNTSKDLKIKEEYYIIHDMIFPDVPLLHDRHGPFELSLLRYLICPWTLQDYLFLLGHEKEKNEKNKIFWWLILKSTWWK